MFTGIVEAVGRITEARTRSGGLRLAVDAQALKMGDIAVGDSIALNGCCLTVIERSGATLAFDVSAETLACTTGLDRIGEVNLEMALRVGDRLGGHMMSGHVDGVGVIARFESAQGDADSMLLDIEAPADLVRFIAPKGSIAVNGVSLTLNTVVGRRFCVNLIPHTLAVTTLKHLSAGARVNLEVDLLARYVARLHEMQTMEGKPWT
jgi:riboflavin synthase